MESTNSNLRRIIEPVMADINASLSAYASPNGVFATMETLIGIEEETSMSETPRIVWVPKYDDGYHVADEQPDDAHAAYYTWTVLDVFCWGTDLDEACRLRAALLTKASDRYSGNAFKPVGRGTYSKGLSTERGVRIALQVAFKIPIINVVYQQALVTKVNVVGPDPLGGGTGGDPGDPGDPGSGGTGGDPGDPGSGGTGATFTPGITVSHADGLSPAQLPT